MSDVTNEPPPYPSATCPTCHRSHSAALLNEGDVTTMLCECGKLLRIERGPNARLVVIEQIPPLPISTPPQG